MAKRKTTPVVSTFEGRDYKIVYYGKNGKQIKPSDKVLSTYKIYDVETGRVVRFQSRKRWNKDKTAFTYGTRFRRNKTRMGAIDVLKRGHKEFTDMELIFVNQEFLNNAMPTIVDYRRYLVEQTHLNVRTRNYIDAHAEEFKEFEKQWTNPDYHPPTI